MALTATFVSNSAYGPDVIAYDIADDGGAATGTVTFDPGTVYTPEYAIVQPTSVAAAGRTYAASINSTTGAVTVTTAVTVGAAATARVFVGRWARNLN
jgi:hypothetical protein